MTDEKKSAPGQGAIEEDVMAALRHSGLDRENLAELVKLVTTFAGRGVRPVKVFPLGTPVPDGVMVQSILERAALPALMDIIADLPRIDEVRVFTKGLPRPDIFMTEIRIR